MAKKDDRLGAIAQAAKKVQAAPAEKLKTPAPTGYMAAQRGARTGWNPELGKGGEVRTYTPAQKIDAILDEAKAKRAAVSPKPKPASQTVGKKLPAAESFNRMPASSKPMPNRAFSSYRPGTKADMAYSGVKPKGVSPSGPRQRTLTPPSVGSTPTTPAKPPTLREPPAPKARLTGRLVGLGVAINAGQAIYYEAKRRKNQKKAK